MFELLADPRLYLASIDKLAEGRRRAEQALGRDEPAARASALGPRGRVELARHLAKTVSRGEYVFSAVTPRLARIEGRVRTLYCAGPLDEIVLGTLAQFLQRGLDPVLSECVYSYRRGRSSLGAVQALLGYLRAHRAQCPEPRARGLYVVRRDVRAYGDSIPTGRGSRLWPLLASALQAHGISCSPPELRWLCSAIAPAVRAQDGSEAPLVRGVPTGSPLQPVMCNLYLTPADAHAHEVRGGFYARFGDDIIFAHPEHDVAREVMVKLDRELASLELAPNEAKCTLLYWNGAGRPSVVAPEFRGRSQLSYLGVRADFRGHIGLTDAKASRLLLQLRQRIEHALVLLAEDVTDRARVLCAVVNASLDPEHPTAHETAQFLRYVVSDRTQLRSLDYGILLRLAEALSRRRGVRAFRVHPPRALRDLGLVSLVAARRRSARRAG